MDSIQLQQRLKSFAYNVSVLVNELPYNTLGKYFKDQLLRSAFSAAANYRAACIAQSKAAFTAKISIAFEEADESVFWLECIRDLKYSKSNIDKLIQEGTELSKILGASRKTSQ
jgi:four helix bundle protein